MPPHGSRPNGIDTPTADAVTGLGWAGTDGDRKTVQRARKRLRAQQATSTEAVS